MSHNMTINSPPAAITRPRSTPELTQRAAPPTSSTEDQLWEHASQYVRSNPRLFWCVNGQTRQVSLLEIYKLSVPGDSGGIGKDPPDSAQAEAIDISILEFDQTIRVHRLRSLQELCRYLVQSSKALVNRLFLIANITSGVVGLLGSHLSTDPEFFSRHLLPHWYNSQFLDLPSSLAKDDSIHLRFMRHGGDKYKMDSKMSLCFPDKSTSHTTGVLLLSDYDIHNTACLNYKSLEPLGKDLLSTVTLRELLIQQAKCVTYRQCPPLSIDLAAIFATFSAFVIEQSVMVSSLSKTADKVQDILAEISWAFNSEIPPSKIAQLQGERRFLLANSTVRDFVKTIDLAIASFKKCTQLSSVGQDVTMIHVLGEDLQSLAESARELRNDYDQINKKLLALHGRPNHSPGKEDVPPPRNNPGGGTTPLPNSASEHLNEKSKGGGSRDDAPPLAKEPRTRRMSCCPFNLLLRVTR